MVDLAGIGSILTGVGGLASSFKGDSYYTLGQYRDQDWARQRWMYQTDYQRQKEFAQEGTGWAFDDLMEAADQAGIHRLSALGAAGGASYSPAGGPTGGQAPIGQGSDIGAGIEALGNALSRSEQQKMNKKQQEADLRIKNEQADLIEATSRTEQAKARNAALGGPGSENFNIPPGSPAKVGTKQNPLHLYVWGYDPRSKKEGWIVNPELGDMEQLPVALGASEIWAEIPGEGTRPLTRKEWQILKKPDKITKAKLPKSLNPDTWKD